MNGKIFSIEEFSTFDGPGIRCTVFLKGCPLRCQWCHNPEGQEFHSQILKSPNGCIGCGNCIRSGMTEESILLCPKGLLRKCGEELSPQDLFDKLDSRLSMLKTIAGGITFSGGEPLSQPQFLKECLSLFHPVIHTALQTSGYAKPEVFSSMLPHLDYVLYDLKLMDEEKHRFFTGVSNQWILQNYEQLTASGVPFITRIPLIPGVNDTEENLSETAAYIHSLGVKQVELLPYNTAAGAKYPAAGKEYRITFNDNIPPNPRKYIFEQHSIEVKVL